MPTPRATTIDETPPTELISVDIAQPSLKAGDLVAFCLTARDISPATIERLLPEGKLHLKATVMQEERYRVIDANSPVLFRTRHVQANWLYQRVRSFDPPIQRGDGGIIDAFSTTNAQEPGGPLTAGTWFDPRPWHITLTGTRHEQKDNHNMVVVPFEQRQLAVFDGIDLRQWFDRYQRERLEGGWDRIDHLWQRAEAM